ncbi:SusC/RagA family TonB-linked outer membrane protein [Pseudobacter ginsenosidimutans]|uniref:TonB-linked SusC/RagA family outer membrane protein n=1 Tax=Pseudobacter ginsenosidimutans TaxID=661488 RepID=A0A4Q7MUJ6_9BACT|nr:SusC/RagA family TonB-linked outer membrane protein [Pseudobacter ginsenosidimutans]QEC42419.1 SusC/RagA family TonB-linked outer membrane protein [Pseudobacter ginsenosidimutans]RZS70730.1 TonB-linked SusC/RagA family outer membrane protein [Pseudobacter ginsenosidimutans]
MHEMLRVHLLLVSIFIFSSSILFAGSVYEQGKEQTRITLSFKNVPIRQVFSSIEEKADVIIMYENTDEMKSTKISINASNMKVSDILNQILKDKSLEWTIRDNVIRLVQKKKETGVNGDAAAGNDSHEKTNLFQFIVCKVVDSTGAPIASASFSIRGTDKKGAADNTGRFVLPEIKLSDILILSAVGYVQLSVPVTDMLSMPAGTPLSLKNGKVKRGSGTEFTFILSLEEKAMEEVVVSTGMFDRKKETFTGVTRTYTGKEVRLASRQNILEALNLLDPSFRIIRDNNLGSDPNQLAKIEMRGSRSMPPPTPQKYSQQLKLQYEKDPNQPLFVLDGFETDLLTVMNLDVNRIASITLLKDAASTALYGSRSANGVVVIQTIRPAPGDLRITYSATGTLVMPDLSGYNMMDARELLKFQELASVGANAPGPFTVDGYNIVLPKVKHAFRENAILQGVDENWLKVPLQNAGSVNHNLSVSGGDSYFTYVGGLNRNSNIGVMKGSENSNTSGYFNLSYRKGNINVSNNLTINGQKQYGSPYGSFTEYVKIPPYYMINNSDRYLEQHNTEYYTSGGFPFTAGFRFSNPLYNAGLPFKNTVKGNTITNNLMANWDVFPFLRLSGSFQYLKSESQSDFFVSPLNTRFDEVESSLKGSYDYSNLHSESYSGNFTMTFNKVVAGKHIFNTNLRSEFQQSTTETSNISAVGFATTAEPLIYLANSFTPDSRPGGTTTKQTSMNFIASLNYSYDLKYSMDLSYALSGTSIFGLDNPYKPFYAMGLKWNLHRENFMRNIKWVNELALATNFGVTGNQNAGNFGSRATYLLNNTPTFFGESVKLVSVGNPDLDWTKTYNLSYNLIGKFFNKLSLTVSGFRNITNPLIITMPLPPSVGIPDGIPRNIGRMTETGLELDLDARLVNTRDWTLNLSLKSPVLYKREYSGLGNSLEKFNDSARNGGYAQRYYDGASPDDVWAVRSVGIGQARGMEVFLDKNGQYTFLFDKNNEVVIGSSRPVTQGDIAVRARYKRFTLAVFCRYIVQEMKFNDALYNKVENISKAQMEYNQDKRALYVRWKQAGDDASFLGITNTTLGMSSRFLQKENSFAVNNITFNYDLLDQYSQGLKAYIRKKLGLETFGFSLTTTNIFQFKLSNIQRERGLDYPFQRSITLNVNMTF